MLLTPCAFLFCLFVDIYHHVQADVNGWVPVDFRRCIFFFKALRQYTISFFVQLVLKHSTVHRWKDSRRDNSDHFALIHGFQ